MSTAGLVSEAAGWLFGWVSSNIFLTGERDEVLKPDVEAHDLSRGCGRLLENAHA